MFKEGLCKFIENENFAACATLGHKAIIADFLEFNS